MVLKKLIQNVFHPSRRIKKGKVIPFPERPLPQEEMSSSKRYLIELFKMKGYKIIIDDVQGSYSYDLALPEYKIKIYCTDAPETDNLEKIYRKKLSKHAHSLGCQLIIVRKSTFYKDIHLTFHKISQRRFEQQKY